MHMKSINEGDKNPIIDHLPQITWCKQTQAGSLIIAHPVEEVAHWQQWYKKSFIFLMCLYKHNCLHKHTVKGQDPEDVVKKVSLKSVNNDKRSSEFGKS